MSEPTNDQEQEVPPSRIIVEFEGGPLSANAKLIIENVSPFQMWGAGRLIDQTATDNWQAMQMQRAMQQAQEQSKITPVHGSVKGVPMDHLRRKGN